MMNFVMETNVATVVVIIIIINTGHLSYELSSITYLHTKKNIESNVRSFTENRWK